MMTFIFIIFAFASALTTTVGLFLPFETGKIKYVPLFFIDVVMIIGAIYLGNSNLSKNPTKQDVIDGKAIYQETQIITGNDTIKTYDIIWKQI